MKSLLALLLLIPSLSWGLTFKNGQVQDGEIPGKPLEVFFKENAGLDKSDTTINIIGGAELNNKFAGSPSSKGWSYHFWRMPKFR